MGDGYVTIITTHFLFIFLLFFFFNLLCHSSFSLFRACVVALFSECSLYQDPHAEHYGAHFGSKQIYKEHTTLRPVLRIQESQDVQNFHLCYTLLTVQILITGSGFQHYVQNGQGLILLTQNRRIQQVNLVIVRTVPHVNHKAPTMHFFLFPNLAKASAQ